MAILAGNVKLVASAVMDDVPEGGGAPTSRVIQDNVSNEIFKDISESDRARGRFNASKVHVSVQTDDVDTYLGANVIVARPPEDPNVNIALFTTNSVYDTREEAVARLEAYLNKGPEWGGFLYENHISGQRTIQLFQRVNSEDPPVGRTLCLVQNEGASNQIEQYVRATRVSSIVRTFTYGTDSDYQAKVVTLELSDTLRYDFRGTSANRQFQRSSAATLVRDTVVADAAVYVGVTPLAQPIPLGSYSLKANSIYTPLVPSSQVETPILATTPIAASATPARAGRSYTYNTAQEWSTTVSLSLPGGCVPGTLSIVESGTTITDKGGQLVVGEAQVGSIDYANGILSLLTGSFPGTKQITYEPAAYLLRMPQSSDIPVTQESRSLNYVGFVVPPPMPGTTTVSFMAQGRWYVLSDDGSGALRGFDAAHGAGTIDLTSGAYVVTLGELPDVGSSVVIQWGVPTQEHSHPVESIKLSHRGVLDVADGESMNPSLLNFSWTHSAGGVSTPMSATTLLSGQITGDATGAVNLATNEYTFVPNILPPYGTEITATYDVGPQTVVTLAHPSRDGTGNLPVNAGATNLVPGSVVVQWNTLTDVSVLKSYTREQLDEMGVRLVDPIQTARDNGIGTLMLNGAPVGTVDYLSGDIVFQPDVSIKIPVPLYTRTIAAGSQTERWRINYQGLDYIDAASMYPNDESGSVTIKFYNVGGDTRKTDTFVYRPTTPLLSGAQAPVTAGSVILTTGDGRVWGDSGTGQLREVQTDGSLLQRGTIDYITGNVTLTSWPVGISGSVARSNLITSLGENVSSAYVFRTAAAPLRPGSLSVQFARSGGGVQTVTAALDGTITATGVTGTVDYQTGLVRLGFGEMVTAAGNEDEPWYNANAVEDGMVFKPAPVQSSTVKYTAVAYSYQPLNADIVGVDPVRLPSDGRVPIFRNGSMVVVGNTRTVPSFTPANGMVIDLARTRLSRAVVRDSTGTTVYDGYTVDLEAGTLTFTDTSGMAAPVTIEHRVEDMLVIREVEISGDMTFTRQISHSYPVEGTYVSSALEFGDRWARVSTVFDQATWNGTTWDDAPSGTSATGTYNTVLSPIEVTNYGASTERFALWFTSSTQFRILGEHVGQIGTGDINAVCAPINPATGHPYFTINPLGWGSGWATGNVLRLNTVGALAPVWVVRTVQPGVEAGIDYSFDLLTRGDVNRP